MSPFVRKTAAHAIPKLYSLDPEMKEELIAVLEKLLANSTTRGYWVSSHGFRRGLPRHE
jgi:hypothetical protein